MKDVAAAAGVSVATVSIVLSGKHDLGRIPSETQRKVRDAADRLGYRRNEMASALRRQQSDTIGLISDFIATTPHAGALLQGTQDALWEAGKALFMVNTEGHADIERAAIDAMLGRQVDGVIYASMYHRNVQVPDQLHNHPLVLLDARSDNLAWSSVVPDEEGGAHAAISHLVDAGHRRIGYLIDEAEKPASRQRLDGYRRALTERGIPIDEDLVIPAEPEHTGGEIAAHVALELEDPPTALACFNDRMAAGAVRAARKLGLSIPRDLSLVGFDNQELVAPLLDPPLTTVQLPHREMGHWAGRRMLDLLDDPASPALQHREPCRLVVRESVSRPRND